MNLLSHKQHQFAHAIAAGARYTDAYRQVYSDRGKPSTTRTEASRLANLPKIVAAVEGLRKPVPTMEQQAQLGLVQGLLGDCQAGTTRERNRAFATLNQMLL